MDVLVAIDVGTSGARASAFDVSGTPIAEVRRSYPTELPGEGRAEQDARRWPTAALSALTSLVKGLNHDIAAIGLTGQCPSVVPPGSPAPAAAPRHHLPRQPGHGRGGLDARALRRAGTARAHRPPARRVPRRGEDPPDPRT